MQHRPVATLESSLVTTMIFFSSSFQRNMTSRHLVVYILVLFALNGAISDGFTLITATHDDHPMPDTDKEILFSNPPQDSGVKSRWNGGAQHSLMPLLSKT